MSTLKLWALRPQEGEKWGCSHAFEPGLVPGSALIKTVGGSCLTSGMLSLKVTVTGIAHWTHFYLLPAPWARQRPTVQLIDKSTVCVECCQQENS